MNEDLTASQSVYYQHTKYVRFASQVSQHIRRRMFQRFVDNFPPTRQMRVLDVGVTSDLSQAESNYFEKMYPFPESLTCVGTEDGSHLVTEYPGLRYQQVIPGQPLPFDTAAFDVVFSNAVLEHVGSFQQQAAFLREIARVGKAFFLTTPNRWFPVEHHTGLPLIHFLPAPVFRGILRSTKYKYWALESNLNMLTATKLKQLFPSDLNVVIEAVSFYRLRSNLIAFKKAIEK